MQLTSLTGAIRQYNLSCAFNDYLKIDAFAFDIASPKESFYASS